MISESIPDLSLVCVIHNQFNLIQSELRKLVLYTSEYNLEIVVWDNASDDLTSLLFSKIDLGTKVKYYNSPTFLPAEVAFKEAEKTCKSKKILRFDLNQIPNRSLIDINYTGNIITSAHSPGRVTTILDTVEKVEALPTPEFLSKSLKSCGVPIGERSNISLLKRDLIERGWLETNTPERGLLYFGRDSCGVVLKVHIDSKSFFGSGTGRTKLSVEEKTFLKCPG